MLKLTVQYMQGHSRTIVGVERTVSGLIKLLVLDPSHSSRALLENPLRMVRKSLVHMKSSQYQVPSSQYIYYTSFNMQLGRINLTFGSITPLFSGIIFAVLKQINLN